MKNSKKRAESSSFSSLLRALMSEKDMTVRQAAEVAGVSSSTVDDWRGGAAPADYRAVRRLAEGLGVTLAFLLTGEEEKLSQNGLPSVTEVFQDGGALFDGYAKITIQRLIPRKKG